MEKPSAAGRVQRAVLRSVIVAGIVAVVPVLAELIIYVHLVGFGVFEMATATAVLLLITAVAAVVNHGMLTKEWAPTLRFLEIIERREAATDVIKDGAVRAVRYGAIRYIVRSAVTWGGAGIVALVVLEMSGRRTYYSTLLFLGFFTFTFLLVHGLCFLTYKYCFRELLEEVSEALDEERAVRLAPLTLPLKLTLILLVVCGMSLSAVASLGIYQQRHDLTRIFTMVLAPVVKEAAGRVRAGESLETAAPRHWGFVSWFVLDEKDAPSDPAAFGWLHPLLRQKLLQAGTAPLIEDVIHDHFLLVEPLEGGSRLVAAVDRSIFGNPLKAVTFGQAFVTALAGLAIGFFLFVQVRDVSAPVRQLRERADRIARGDLSAGRAAYADDEVGVLLLLFTRASRQLGHALAASRQLAQQVAASAAELQGTAQSLLSWSEEVQQSARGVDGAVAEIQQGSEQVDGIMRSTRESASQAAGRASRGQADLDQGAVRLRQLGQELAAVFSLIEELSARGERIGGIVEAIREITAQTDLLSLNAAIEASRAGEHGRGFAVVADEIRKLADRAEAETRQIDEVVREVAEATLEAASQVQAAREEFSAREQGISATAGNFQEITKAFGETEKAFGRLAELVTHQAGRSGEAAAAARKIRETQAEQVTAASQLHETAASLHHLAEDLAKRLERFRVEGGA